jgi:hypothetical protein
MEPVKFAEVIPSGKRKISLSLRVSSSISTKFLLTIWNDGVVLTKNVNDIRKKCNDSREIFGGNVMHNHDADSKDCLNRQLLNNSVKMKAMVDLCEGRRTLIHEELLGQDLDAVTYKDITH